MLKQVLIRYPRMKELGVNLAEDRKARLLTAGWLQETKLCAM